MHARHILPLTGLRLAAALWVVAFHLQPTFNRLFPALHCLEPVTSIGYQAVPLFFLLSGFILSHNYFETYSLSQHHQFIILRWARLWPVHIVLLLFYIANPDITQLRGQQLQEFFEEATMTRYWFHTDLQWNGPAWSISCEWLAYLTLFPLSFLAFKKLKSPALLAAIVIGCIFLQTSFQDYATSIKLPGRWPGILFLFPAGSALYRLHCLIKNPPARAITFIALALAAGYVTFPSLNVGVLNLSFALLIFGLAYDRGPVAKCLSTKFAVRGGLASYSLYMSHILVVLSFQCYFLHWLPPSAWLRLAILLAVLGAVTALALLVHRYIEEPAHRILINWFHPGFARKKTDGQTCVARPDAAMHRKISQN